LTRFQRHRISAGQRDDVARLILCVPVANVDPLFRRLNAIAGSSPSKPDIER
jgi:hypothetical protein